MKKGSLTVEAAIIVPFIILLIFSLATVNVYFFVYEKIDYEITKVAFTIAEKSYVAKSLNFTFSDTTPGEIAQKSVDNITKSCSDFSESVVNTPTMPNGSNIVEFAQSAVTAANEIYDYIQNVIDKGGEVLKAFFPFKGDFVKGLAASFVTQTLADILKQYLKTSVEDSLGLNDGKELSDYFIAEDGLNFDESKLWTSEGDHNNLIKLIVKYKMELPMYGLAGKKITINVKHTRLIRAWVAAQ